MQKLKDAMHMHQAGKKAKAIDLYQKCYEEGERGLALYVNLCSLLREEKELTEAIRIGLEGTKLHAKQSIMWASLGQSYADSGDSLKAIYALRRAVTLDNSKANHKVQLWTQLQRGGFNRLATRYALYNLAGNNDNAGHFLTPFIECIIDDQKNHEKIVGNYEFGLFMEGLVGAKSQLSQFKQRMLLALLWAKIGDLNKCKESHKAAISNYKTACDLDKELHASFKENWFSFNWNMSIFFLKKGELEYGWSLYDNGLQVPAMGAQKWQRSLKKPFSAKDVKIWKGENLGGKSILLLGEQGIGDTIMFTSLVQRLKDRKNPGSVYFLSGERLEAIYKRSFKAMKIVSLSELRELGAQHFDYMLPIGSLPDRLRLIKEDYTSGSFLRSDQVRTRELRRSYLELANGRKIIGISWQGGGRADRIHLKSVELKTLEKILNCNLYFFVSLQYGDDKPHIEKYRKKSGVDIYHDDSINPIKDFDGWISQVDATDAVVSIANTTVHGAAALGKPTAALVSRRRDWRWIDPEISNKCYWYRTVTPFFESKNKGWTEAVDGVVNWMREI